MDPLARVRDDLLLLHGDLEHAPHRPVVLVHRGRSKAGIDLVEQPALDLLGRHLSDAVGVEAGDDVRLEVPPVGLLRARRQAAAESEERLGPLGKRDVGVGRVEPCTAGLLDLHLA